MARAIYRSQSIDDFMKERNDRIVSRIVTRKIYPVKTFQGGTSPLKTRLRVYHEVFLHRAFDFLSLEIQPEACASPADDIARISKRVPEAQLPYNSSASFFLNMPQRGDRRYRSFFHEVEHSRILPFKLDPRFSSTKASSTSVYIYIYSEHTFVSISFLSSSFFSCLEKNSIVVD